MTTESEDSSAEIREKVKLLADGLSTQSKYSNRIWLTLAMFSLFAIIAEPNGKGEMRFLGQLVAEEWFYFYSSTISSILYIVFCSAYSQAFRAADQFRLLVNSLDNDNAKKKFYGKVIWKDAAHLLYQPTYVRIYPITHAISYRLLKLAYVLIFKLLAIVLYYILPFVIIVYFLLKDKLCWQLERDWPVAWWVPYFVVIVLLTFLPVIPLILKERKWLSDQLLEIWNGNYD